MASDVQEIILSDGRKINKENVEKSLHERRNNLVKHGYLMKLLVYLGEQIGEAKSIAQRKDSNALLEAAAMKKLESLAQAVRDHCASFLYRRTSAEIIGPAKKELPAWLK